MSIFNSITTDIYGSNPKRKDPKRKDAKGNQYRKPDSQTENMIEKLDTQSLVDENQRLHELQQDLKRRKFLGGL